MTFRQLIAHLEDRIGNHQIPMRHNCHEIRDFIDADGVHPMLIKNVVRRIYKANRCGYLDAAVTSRATLDALACIRAEMLASPHTDLDEYHLIEAIYTHSRLHFSSRNARATAERSTPRRGTGPKPKACAEVIYLVDPEKAAPAGLISE